MTKIEREALEQIYRFVCLPQPPCGTATTTARAFIRYADDMRIASRAAWTLICVMLHGEEYPGHLREEISHVRDTLDDLERSRDE